jgi:signal transduction histidine kinase/ligand-binding sensor domain-containing protein
MAQKSDLQNAENKYRAVHWTLQDGLSSGITNSILKDINGFIWIGTDHGLNRFDGNIFKKYYHEAQDTTSISGNSIFGIVEDSLHNLWIGTERGLSRYDMKTDTFSNFKPGTGKKKDLHIVSLYATRSEVIVLETSTPGIFAYDIHTYAKKSLVSINEKDSLEYRPNILHTFFDSASNSIWVLRGFIGAPGGGLVNISLANGERKIYGWPCYRNIPGHSHYSEGMIYDHKRNALWINSADGLLEFTLVNKKFQRVEALNDIFNLKNYGREVGLDMDRKGRIWIATRPRGMLVYDPADQSLTIPFPRDSILQRDISNENSALYYDREGMIWSGFWTPNGVYQIIPINPAVKLFIPDSANQHYNNNNLVIELIKIDSGKRWVSTLGGNYLFDTKTGKTRIFKDYEVPGVKSKDTYVGFQLDDLQKRLVIWNWGNLLLKDLKTKTSRTVIFKDSQGIAIKSLLITSSLRFRDQWITEAQYNGKERIFYGNWDSATLKEILNIPGNRIFPFFTYTDEDHLIFLKREEDLGNLTYKFSNGRFLQTKSPMDIIQWTSIFFNPQDKTFWVAGEKKIFHFDQHFKMIRHYTNQEGVPDLDINGLMADQKGNIWFHTDRSIQQLNIETGEVSTLSERDGFESQSFSHYSLNYIGDSGDLYFAGGDLGRGFNRIIPDKFTNPPSTAYMQTIAVNQKPFPLPTGINNLRELSLDYNENKITIETGILDFYSKGSSHIRYKMEFESDSAVWLFAPANYTIRFEDLKPGKYTLRMQASNAALQFTGPVKVLAILISPPWWQTWWARILFGLLLISTIVGIIQYRSRSLKEKNIMLEEKVLHRTKELKHSLEELRTTQDQLIQQEKMASLGELTAGIAHEIQNPLNFVNNFSDINSELIDEMKQDIQTGHFEEGLSVAEMVKENNLKINLHGKRADSIVKGMLMHSRKSTGQKEPASLNDLADEYLRLSYHGLRAKDKSFNVTMLTDFDKSIEKIYIIPQDIGRVFLNIFNNSLYAVAEKRKLYPEGQTTFLNEAGVAKEPYEPTVSVTTKKMDNQVEIRIKDNGMGIPRKLVDKIFQPFFTTKPAGQGTGLGLSLSYDIIKKGHSGELKVNSMEGEYTEFIILLPNDQKA